jgi:signal-transduction protein with cAMP-binding, CBS, and nucleotidyltransferase domain
MSIHSTIRNAPPRITAIPMFADLSEENQQAIADLVTARHFDKGSLIIGQGDPATCMYLLMSGRVKVSLASCEGKELVLDYLEAPAHFGEMSLVDAKARSADVFAVTDVDVLVLEGPVLGDPGPASPGVEHHSHALTAASRNDFAPRRPCLPRRHASGYARRPEHGHCGA